MAKPARGKPPQQPKSKATAKAKPPKSASGEPAAPRRSVKVPGRTIAVHALADERVHLAPAQLGRLRQGYLKTLCGLQAVSALSPFALADKSQKQCKTCFGKVDDNGLVVA